MLRIRIDPNVRIANGYTVAGTEDIDPSSTGWALAVNQEVEVYEPESGGHTIGMVMAINQQKGLIVLQVPWHLFYEPETP
jgi:hypothetical protein